MGDSQTTETSQEYIDSADTRTDLSIPVPDLKHPLALKAVKKPTNPAPKITSRPAHEDDLVVKPKFPLEKG